MAPRHVPFSLLAKPTGAACNLDCTYCFFLSKELLYDSDGQRMSAETLRTYLENYLAAQPDGEVTVAWQGGEPTMRGLAFFREAVRLAEELRRPRQRVTHSLQTNGTLLDDDWCVFFAEHRFLVGLSVDGPKAMHDEYRVNKGGRGSHDLVMRGWRLLQQHRVETNVLCTVNAANQDHPLEVYRFFRDEMGARFLQFIPVVERVEAKDLPVAERGWRGEDGSRLLYRQSGEAVTSRSVDPVKFGRFLSAIWDEWVTRDVGEVFVQHFDVTLGNRFGRSSLCVHAPTCGDALAVEHNGDVYSCDHFVEPGYLIGNVTTDRFDHMVTSEFQRDFGRSKLTGLTRQCQECPVRWACHGGCPKDRFATSRDGERGQNYLCEGYFDFFSHVTEGIDEMAQLLRSGRQAADIMQQEQRATSRVLGPSE